MNLTYAEKIQIQKDVVLGAIPPAGESVEAAEFRAGMVKDFQEAKAAGLMLDFPKDWDEEIDIEDVKSKSHQDVGEGKSSPDELMQELFETVHYQEDGKEFTEEADPEDTEEDD